MLDAIVRASIRDRVVVLGVTALFMAVGFFAARRLPIDEVPDVTNVQVQVLTDSAGLSAEEVERYVTLPRRDGAQRPAQPRRDPLSDPRGALGRHRGLQRRRGRLVRAAARDGAPAEH